MIQCNVEKREQADRVIIEIASRSNGHFLCPRMRLIKIFYYAHVFYAKQHRHRLTEWPVRRIPSRQAIDDFEQLVNRLINEGVIADSHGIVYLRDSEANAIPMSESERAAITAAIDFVDTNVRRRGHWWSRPNSAAGWLRDLFG